MKTENCIFAFAHLFVTAMQNYLPSALIAACRNYVKEIIFILFHFKLFDVKRLTFRYT
jgi:hypothetical protein